MNKYYYETPRWAVALLCLMAVLMSALFLAGAYYWDVWAGDAPEFIRWGLALVGLVFLLVALKPRNWQPWRYFVADEEGIHFPSECPQTKASQWLLVPWNRVGTVQRARFLNRSKGLTIDLFLNPGESDGFFDDVERTRNFFRQPAQEEGVFKVGYSNVFKNIDRAVGILNRMKATYTGH